MVKFVFLVTDTQNTKIALVATSKVVETDISRTTNRK